MSRASARPGWPAEFCVAAWLSLLGIGLVDSAQLGGLLSLGLPERPGSLSPCSFSGLLSAQLGGLRSLGLPERSGSPSPGSFLHC